MTHATGEVVRDFKLTDAQVRARGHEMLVQGRANKAALAAKDPDITDAWFDEMAEALELCDTDAGNSERQAPAKIERQDRDADVKEARPLLGDIYLVAKRAYPGPSHTAMVASFGGPDYTRAGNSVPRMLDVMRLTFRRASDPAIKAVLLTKGLDVPGLDRLGILCGEVQEAATSHAVAAGDAHVGTQAYVTRLNTLWNDRMRILNQDAIRAFRLDPARRRLFRLYDPAHDGETHELTVKAGHPHAFALDAPVDDKTVYEFRVLDHATATGRVSRSPSADHPGLGGRDLQPMKRTDHALHVTGAELGAAGGFLVLECLTGDHLHVRVRVLPADQ